MSSIWPWQPTYDARLNTAWPTPSAASSFCSIRRQLVVADPRDLAAPVAFALRLKGSRVDTADE
jgi:hypothetical protein